MVVSHRDAVGTGRIEPPLENVAVNDDRPRKIPVAVPLIDWPRVNNKGPRCHLALKIRSVNPIKPAAALQQQLVDRQSPGGIAGIQTALAGSGAVVGDRNLLHPFPRLPASPSIVMAILRRSDL